MDKYNKIRVLWEGKLLLDRIKWNKRRYNEFKLSHLLNQKIEIFWKNHIEAFPNDYDGNLIFLDEFHFNHNDLFLDTSYMKFSTANYMVKNKIPVKKGIGPLGVQYLVFSPDKRYIIMGKRALNESYYPGALTIPGGILETGDLDKLPKEALMREAFEEIGVPLENEAYLIAMLAGWNDVSVAFLISTSLNKSYKFDLNERIKTIDDEWEGNLRWFPVSKLKNLQENQILDGLLYYRSKLESKL